MPRAIRDELLKVTTALPAAAANADSDSIDLEQASAFPVNEGVDVEIVLPATPDLTDGDTITITLQDSADDNTFASIEELATLVVTGAGGTGGPAATRVVRLPSSTKRYINANAAVLTGGGDNTDVSYTLSLLL